MLKSDEVKLRLFHVCSNLIATLNYPRAQVQSKISFLYLSMANFAWNAAILDLILAVLFAFLLIRIVTSSDEYFRKPFYTLFVATGLHLLIFHRFADYSGTYNILSVISYIPMSHFVSSPDKRIYSAAYVRIIQRKTIIQLSQGF